MTDLVDVLTDRDPHRRNASLSLPCPARWQEALEDRATWLHAAGRPATTVYLRDYQMRRVATSFAERSPWSLTTDELVSWMAARGAWSAETRRSYRSAIRGFYRWAAETGRLEHDPSRLLPAVHVGAGRPRPAPESVVKMALASADERTWLMLMLGACLGLRRAEIAKVRTDDLVGESLRVVGKGGRVRVVPVPPAVAAAMRQAMAGWLFPSIRSSSGHMSPASVGKLLSRHLEDDYTAHSLRHRFASVAYAADRDIRAVQDLLGHTKPETTARYTAVPDGALRRAVNAASELGTRW